jgi:shikimate kinase
MCCSTGGVAVDLNYLFHIGGGAVLLSNRRLIRQRAVALLLNARHQEVLQHQDQTVHPGLQAGIRALWHPRRWPRRD